MTGDWSRPPSWVKSARACRCRRRPCTGLNHVGLHETLETKAYKPEDQCVRHFKDGQPLAWINRGQRLIEQYGERYYLIHRADLHDALSAGVRAQPRGSILLSKRCRSCSRARPMCRSVSTMERSTVSIC